MKKKTVANLVMVAIIAAIAVSGMLGVGYIQGWFDRADGTQAFLTEVKGVIQLQRDGVSYPVNQDTVLREGDQLSCEAGASAVIQVGESRMTIGEQATLAITASAADNFAAEVTGGAVFANCTDSVKLTFAGKQIVISDAVALISVRSGAQSVSVFSGAVENAEAGQLIDYIGEEVTVRPLQIKSLNAFALAQVRNVNKTTMLCFTNAQIDKLEADRNDALQDIINGQNPTQPDEVHTHEYVVKEVTASCTADGYTQYTCACGDSYQENIVTALGHSFTTYVGNGNATCTDDGTKTAHCDRCDEISTVADEGSAKGHSHIAKVIAPTCTAQGYTQYTCYCGDNYTDSVTEVTDHAWGDWLTVQSPTTSQKGLQERSCCNCDAKEQKNIDKLPEIHNHSYVQKLVAATCITDGYTLNTCTCGDSYTSSTVKALGHSFTEFVSNGNATCTEDGTKTAVCDRCNEISTVTDEGSAEGHRYTSRVTMPTCTGQGFTAHTCACGDTYTDSYTEALGHSWSGWVTTQNPTSDEEGVKTRTCFECAISEQQPIEKLPTITAPDTSAGYIYMTIRCDTILDNIEVLDPGKMEFVPADGEILPMLKVYFSEGETAFDVLKRVCEALDIQLEYSWQPMFNVYYIEGINNLYEKDVGPDSGWMYKVNEWFPDVGCSGYTLQNGDVIYWLYSCIGYGTDVGAPEWEG